MTTAVYSTPKVSNGVLMRRVIEVMIEARRPLTAEDLRQRTRGQNVRVDGARRLLIKMRWLLPASTGTWSLNLAGLVNAGILHRGEDGTYRLTPGGHKVLRSTP